MLLGRFQAERHTQRILSFLLFDHIGGFNTLMYALSNHGCAITERRATRKRSVARSNAIVSKCRRPRPLPNLLLMSGAADRYDLSSLKLIDYATEVMPQATLDRLSQALPGVALHQSYGLSEVGIMQTRSRDRGSLWLSIRGDTQTRVVDGILQIKAPTTMLGYLNAPRRSRRMAGSTHRTRSGRRRLDLASRGEIRILSTSAAVKYTRLKWNSLSWS